MALFYRQRQEKTTIVRYIYFFTRFIYHPIMKQKGILIIITLALLAALGAGAIYYLITQDKQAAEQPTPSLSPLATAISTPTTAPTIQPEPIETEETTSIPSSWLTYQSQEYSFEISYSENYQALDDKNNLYGWPNGVVLFYSGGQSYDLPIEVWDDPSEYENKYKTQMDDLTIKKVGNKYITLLNMNREEEVDQIIATFRAID